MKTKIVFASIILFSIVLIIYFINNQDTKTFSLKKEFKKPEAEPEKILSEEKIFQKRTYNFQILPTTEIDVRFPKDGTLELSAKENSLFKKNDLLFQLNTSQQFERIYVKKNELKSQIKEKLNEKKDKSWESFFNEIKENDLLPNPLNFDVDPTPFPEIQLKIEEINKLEKEIFSNFYLAKFDGKVKNVSTKKTVKRNKIIAQIFPIDFCLLQGKIHKNDSSFFANNYLLNQNEKIQLLPTNHADSLLVKNKIAKKHIINYDFFDFFQRSNEN